MGYTITDEYDRNRQDNFRRYNTQGYVFKMNGRRVEVNSSKIPNIYNTPSEIIQHCDLKVTFKDRFNNFANSHSTVLCFVFSVCFYVHQCIYTFGFTSNLKTSFPSFAR